MPPSKRRVWFRVTVLQGTLLQASGLALGFLAIETSHTLGRPAVFVMILGWLLVYLCCHAVAHWAVGRLLGIRFQFYTIGGTEKAGSMPPGLSWLFTHIPFPGVRTEPKSMMLASNARKAAMWAAGVTSSVIFPLAAAGFARYRTAPGGRVLLIFTLLWSLGTVIANFKPGGDFWKARRALQS